MTSGVTGLSETGSIRNATGGYGVSDGESITYYYAYTGSSSSVMKRLKSGESTTPLFGEVKFANIVENEDIENKEFEIQITTYAIQADNIAGDLEATPPNIWKMLSQNLPDTAKDAEDPSTDILKDVSP